MASQYPKNVTTKKGLSLIAESIATKQPITFTRVVVGDGDVPVGKSLNDINTVTSPRMELPVTAGVNEGNGQFKITATLSNRELEVGFFPKEVGMYAKIGNGEEVLYCYTNGGNNVGYIPDKTTPIESEVYNIRVNIGNAKDITIILKDNTYLTAGDLKAHDADEQSHKPIRDVINNIVGTGAWNNKPNKNIKNIIELLGEGAIVASKLDTNGFVKFANNMVIQWGKIVQVAQGDTVSLPIAVSEIISIVGSDENQSNDPLVLTFNDFNNTSFRVYGRRFSMTKTPLWGKWIAICKA